MLNHRNNTRSASRRPKLALVGNAPPTYDLSAQIDSCDIVIRCNEAKTLGVNTGTRTDILCVNNSGAPADRFISKQLLRRHPNFPELTELWFARPFKDCVDLSMKILDANGLSDVPVVYFSTGMNERASKQLRQHNNMEDQHPSTGFLAFCYILEQEEFNDYDKYLFGFTFNMWYGHPEQAEMKVIESFCKNRHDLYFVPAEPLWKLKRRLKGAYIYNLMKRIQKKFSVFQ